VVEAAIEILMRISYFHREFGQDNLNDEYMILPPMMML